jgi:hypothetical protein
MIASGVGPCVFSETVPILPLFAMISFSATYDTRHPWNLEYPSLALLSSRAVGPLAPALSSPSGFGKSDRISLGNQVNSPSLKSSRKNFEKYFDNL